MPELPQIDSLLSEMVSADAGDLPALAQLHGRLQEFEKQLRGLSLGRHAEATVGLWKRVESIALGEVPDPATQLERVANDLAGLKDLVDEVGTFTLPPKGAPVTATAADETASAVEAGPGAHAHDLVETRISADDLQLVRDFLAEANEHLSSVEGGLLRLEADPSDIETLNAVFRGFHSIKGAAGFLHLKQIAALSHAAESLLDDARQGRLTLVGDRMDAVLRSVDVAKALMFDLSIAINQDRAPKPIADLPHLIERLERVRTHPNPGSSQTSDDASAGKSAAPAATKPAAAAQNFAAGGPTTGSGGGSDTTIKVSTDRLDQLINMVGELVIAESMVQRDCTQNGQNAGGTGQRLGRNLSHLAKITRDLQELSMSLRMVPVQGVFQKMTRLVRDTSRNLGKEVNLVLEGGETELDRNVVEALSDPLVHMVRNSVDHGIEMPDKRVASGKSRVGKLTLRARHEAGFVVIDITDDGKGIDASRVLQKARDAGIVGPTQVLPDSEIYKLIFHPGLSTADKVTDVSGRGVGMDVVKKNVEKLRGRIDITSTPGQGSTFTIRLPLTLAVIDGLLISVGSHTYVLPLTSVERNLRPTPEQLSTAFGRGEMCLIRGDLMPLVRLHRLFDIKPNTTEPTESLVVIVHDDSRRCCLLVDNLLGQQQVVIKSLGYGATGTPGIAGGAILGDGNVSLILDVPGLIDLSAGHHGAIGLGSTLEHASAESSAA